VTSRLALVSLAAVLFLPTLWLRDVWNPDEIRYAEVAREMRVLGDWLVPHLNGCVYAEKPPLFFWLSALLQPVAGWHAGHLVSALAVLGAMLFTHAIGRAAFGERTGRLAAAALATTLLVSWEGKRGAIDPLLMFLTTWAAYGFFRGRLVQAYVVIGLAVLAKGPVGLVAPALAGAAASLAGTPRPPAPRRHGLWGPPLAAAIAAAWVVPACLQGGPEYARTILWEQHFGRMVESFAHRQPWHYYLMRFPFDFFPWIFFLPRALVLAWRARREERTAAALLLWFGAGFVFFTLLSGKRERYLFPLYPAAALLVAWHLESSARRWVARLPLAVFALIGLAQVAVCFVRFDVGPDVARVLEPTLPWAAFVAAAGAGLVVLAWRGASLVACMVLFSLSVDFLWIPRVDEVVSPRDVAARVPADAEVALLSTLFQGTFNLYLERTHLPVLQEREEVEAFLDGPGRRLVIAPRGEAARIGPVGERLVEAGRFDHWDVVFLE